LRGGGAADVRFDLIVGRNALANAADREQALAQTRQLLSPEGQLIICETIPREAQRLYKLTPLLRALPEELAAKLRTAEEVIYGDGEDSLVNWGEAELLLWAQAAGFANCRTETWTQKTHQKLSAPQLDRWFSQTEIGNRPSYLHHLQKTLSPTEVQEVERIFRARLTGQMVEWTSTLVLLIGGGRHI
jgi:putative ATPase